MNGDTWGNADQPAANLVEFAAGRQSAGRNMTATCPNAGRVCPIICQFVPVLIRIPACAIIMPIDELAGILPWKFYQNEKELAGQRRVREARLNSLELIFNPARLAAASLI